MDMTDYRERIDEIDRDIVRLYEERMSVCEEIARYKIENGMKVFDRVREQEKLARIKSLTHSDFNARGAQELFEQLMSISRKYQYRMLSEAGVGGNLPFIAVDDLQTESVRVVFQGAEGAYSHIATRKAFGENARAFHVPTFRDAMSAIDEGSAEYAVLPMENSTAGIVNEIFDLLTEYEHYIVGEIDIPIEHCLLGVKGAAMEQIRTVYSHPQSLMQSGKFLADHDWRQISMPNNAFAAQKVAKEEDPSQAAIASELAAQIYGLEILQKRINDEGDNTTRFIIVTNQKIFRKDAGKIRICFELPHESGSLYHILSHFIYNDLNMTKIESRPVEGRTWEYRFFLEFEGNFADGAVRNALRGIRDEARNLKVLGNY